MGRIEVQPDGRKLRVYPLRWDIPSREDATRPPVSRFKTPEAWRDGFSDLLFAVQELSPQLEARAAILDLRHAAGEETRGIDPRAFREEMAQIQAVLGWIAAAPIPPAEPDYSEYRLA